MKRDDFHSEPFDEGTILKLDILSDYLIEWLPVFINSNQTKINIFDFQCGPGIDPNGLPGSPIRIGKIIHKYLHEIQSKRVKISIWFNDNDPDKVAQCREHIQADPVLQEMSEFTELDFKECFPKALESMNAPRSANFVFIDPTGLVPYPDVIPSIARIPRTDFLLFAPAQHIALFGHTPEFQTFIPGFPKGVAVKDVPKTLCDYVRKLVPVNGSFYTAPFAIRKSANSNIYVLLFGSRDICGLDKFLRIAWGLSPNGESNYDLSGDLLFSKQGGLLPGFDKAKKIQIFEKELRKQIITGTIKDTLQVSMFAWQNGFIPQKHAKPVLDSLHQERVIQGKKAPGLSYETVIRKKMVQQILLTNP